jgi:hypothetical protein
MARKTPSPARMKAPILIWSERWRGSAIGT